MSFAFLIRVLNPQKDGYKEGQNVQFHLEKICKKLGVELRTAETLSSVGQISNIIKEALEVADVIFAEISAPNENVWYEVGYSDRIDENKVIILCRMGVGLPFDRAHQKTFFFDPDDHQEMTTQFEKVEAATLEILSVSAINRLILNDRPEDTIPEYIQNNPSISGQSTQFLKKLANNIERPVEVRKRAIVVLNRLGEVDLDILRRLTLRLTDASVRTEVFNLIKDIGKRMPLEVWQNAKDAVISIPVMRAAAIAGGKHFASGLIEQEVVEDIFINHPRWEARKHFLASFLDNCSDADSDGVRFVVSEMIPETRAEISNRFKEWVVNFNSESGLSESERVALEIVGSSHKSKKVRKVAAGLLS